METKQFCELMRLANKEEKDILLNIISHLHTREEQPFQMFLTHPAGSGKTVLIKI